MENLVDKNLCEMDLGDGYKAVPDEAVTLNGIHFRHLPLAQAFRFCLIMPDGTVAMNLEGSRPYTYYSLKDCKEDKEVLKSFEEKAPPSKPHTKTKRGFFGCGVYRPQNSYNIGTLFRSAACFGADFIFTIGKTYKRPPADTNNSAMHVPCYNYSDFEDFERHLPKKTVVVCVENSLNAIDLRKFSHPERAIYLLGSESSGLPEDLTRRFATVIIPGTHCLNVATAGSIVLYDRIAKMEKI